MSKYIICMLVSWLIVAQSQAQVCWHTPANDSAFHIQGQGWPLEMQGKYTRFPVRMKDKIRPAVWRLSQNSAGLSIHFYSDAPEITIRYQVTGSYALPNMPVTGVSGIDLYARDVHGKELWCAGRFHFGDTISYIYSPLSYHSSAGQGYEYHLYLPLYNTVKWLEIGVPSRSKFSYAPLRTEKPIVVYGTSIAQGACASRPGMAWTNILERRLEHPVVNLGFSGNGKLEPSVLSFLNELDAQLFILDCMPNLTRLSSDQIKQLVINAVLQIREKHPETAILLTEHDGYTNEKTNQQQRDYYLHANEATQKAFTELQQEGIQNIYLLSHQNIGMPQDAMVDGVHATDYGMVHYANAYEQIIRNILKEPQGNSRTTRAVPQRRESPGYEWKERHEEILKINRESPPQAIIIGNSITHYWGGLPKAKYRRGQKIWEQYMDAAGFRNLGFGWDKIENMLWRVYHGELDGYQAKKIILSAGTNNLQEDSDELILQGIDTLLQAIRVKQPQAEICIWGILPRKNMEKRIADLNRKIKKLAVKNKILFSDPGKNLLTSAREIDKNLFTDGVHPNEQGYRKIVESLND